MGFGVPGFFSPKKRATRPVALDISFVYDSSGSMDDVIEFINKVETPQAIETALRLAGATTIPGVGTVGGIGTTVPNRYSQSAMEQEVRFGGSIWATGSQILSGFGLWTTSPNGPSLGASDEDVTGSAFELAVRNRQYRAGIARIMISFSDEQAGASLTEQNTVEGQLTSSINGQRFIAASGMNMTVTPNPETDPDFVPFGFVYTTDVQGTAIFRSLTTSAVNYYSVPVANVSWTATRWLGASNYEAVTPPYTFNLADPVVGPSPPSGQSQHVNTPRLAAATNGAVYDITQMLAGGDLALQQFGVSLGEVLGTLLYELLS